MNSKSMREKLKADKQAEKEKQQAEREAKRLRLQEEKLLERKRQQEERTAAKQKLLDEKAAEKLKQQEEKEAEKQRLVEKKIAEKLKAEEEKRLEEERKKQQSAKFFKPLCPKSAISDQGADKCDSILSKVCVPKKDMSIAPSVRRPCFSPETQIIFELDIAKQENNIENLYLSEIKTSKHKVLASCRSRKMRNKLYPITKRRSRPNEQFDIVEIKDDDSEFVNISRTSDQNNTNLVAKLLQFSGNYRPPYYGTWRKRCATLNGRTPFRRAYENFDYDLDSEADWEEEVADADECKSNDEDSDTNDDGDDDDDGFIVEHGYLSEDEEERSEDDVENNEHLDPETRRANMKIKAEAWKAEKLCKKWDKLKPVCVVNPMCIRQAKPADHYFADLFKSMEAITVDSSLTHPFQNQPCIIYDKSSASKCQKRKSSDNKRSSIVSKRNLIDIYCTPPASKLPKIDAESKINIDNHKLVDQNLKVGDDQAIEIIEDNINENELTSTVLKSKVDELEANELRR